MAETNIEVDFDSEAAIVESAGQGDGEAFSLLVARYRDPVYVIARNLLAATADVADVTQDTFATAFCTLRKKPRQKPFKSWLYGIAAQKALRRRHRNGRPAPGTSADVRPKDVTLVLREALEFMDEPTRAAFVIRDLLDLPVDDAAAVLETSPEEIRQQTHRARLLLRGLLERVL